MDELPIGFAMALAFGLFYVVAYRRKHTGELGLTMIGV